MERVQHTYIHMYNTATAIATAAAKSRVRARFDDWQFCCGADAVDGEAG